MNRIVGIDLGTTNSLIAGVDAGIPFVIPDAQGQRLTPSVVHFPAANASPLTGQSANRVRTLRPQTTVASIKRFMGRRGNEVSRDELRTPFSLRTDGPGPVRVEIEGRLHTPEEISAEVLKKLRGDAERYFSETINRAVISVPAHFNDAQRNATKHAGELAGFTVERIINEPTAAALAYGLNKLKTRSRIAVYDLGGGTFDLSILELNEGIFQVIATHGDTRLGGDDLDQRLIGFLASKIADSGLDVLADVSLAARVREAAEAAKIKLSTDTETEVGLPFLTPDFSFQYRLRREELEDLTRDIIVRTRPHCLQALADAKVEPQSLDQVILVGGQTRMPLVRKLVSEIFHCSEFSAIQGGLRVGSDPHRAEGPELNTSQNPEEAVALGAAIQAEILSGGLENVLLLDVTPLSLGLETFGGLMNVLIPRNTTIPVKAGEVFTTAVDNQQSMLIHVLQGERDRAKDNWSVGRFTFDFRPAPKGIPRVGVQFEIDANGILHVLARDLKTNEQVIVQMKSSVDVNDADVQRMVEESVEHAFEDLHARRWVEARLGAQQTLAAARKALKDFGGEIEAGYREQVEQASSKVESALKDEDPETKVGSPEKLKTALSELDSITQPLADLMMERAVEEALQRQGLV